MNYQFDKVDKDILNILIADARTPFTEIAQKLLVSPGTVHVRVKKMEDAGVIKGSTLVLDYENMGYRFIGYLGIALVSSTKVDDVLEDLRDIPEVTVASFTTGKYGVFCKIRCKDTPHAREVISHIMSLSGVQRTETMICLEESINSKNRLIKNMLEE